MSQNFLSQLTGSFAQPCSENPTVAMVEAAYQHHGLEWRYINCEVAPENLKEAVLGAKAMGWRGFNCSLPHKVAVIEHLDELGESAKIIGAVNCAVNRDGQWVGENTDGKGFLKSLKQKVDPADKKVVVFGAGGAARAVAVETALAGANEMIIVNRSDRGQVLADLINEKTRAQARFIPHHKTYDLPEETDIVIQATSVGLYPSSHEMIDVNVDTFLPHMTVCDVIFNEPMTRFLKAAISRDAAVIDGLGMLVNQGVIGIKYWTGVDVDEAVMRKALEELLLGV